MATIKIEMTGNETETVTGSDTFNINGSAETETTNDTATGSDNDTENDACKTTETTTPTASKQNTASLETYIAIFKAGDIMQKRGMAVKMVVLALIERGGLYTEKGYASIYDMAEHEFNLSQQTTRSYLQAAEKFYNIAQYVDTVDISEYVDSEGNFKKTYTNEFMSIFAENGRDFVPSALESMRALSVETIETLLADNVITYDMSARDIKKAIKPYRTRSVENDKTTGSDSNTATTAETETATCSDSNTATTAETETATCSDTETTKKETPKETIARLKAEIAKLQAENAELKTDIKKAYSETKRVLGEYSAALTEIDNLQAENVKLKNSNNSYKAANSRAKKDNDTLKAENETLKTENETLKAGNSAETDNEKDSEILVTITGSAGNDTDNGSDNDTDNGSDNDTDNGSDNDTDNGSDNDTDNGSDNDTDSNAAGNGTNNN